MDFTNLCGKCTDYKKHDQNFGYCRKYKEQRRWDNHCVETEDWFNDNNNKH